MSYEIIDLLSYSVAIAAIIGLIRINKIDRTFIPFIILMFLGLLNESLSSFLIRKGYSNAINANIYSLLEAMLITLFFKKLGLFDRVKKMYLWLLILFVVVWVTENFIISKITAFNSYFNITYSFAIVLMSITMINRVIIEAKKALLTSSVFLICIGFTIFFIYAALIEIFWVYGLNSSPEFSTSVYRIMTYINLLVNLIYALAILWIPRKREYILL
jgi:hypothetical protein